MHRGALLLLGITSCFVPVLPMAPVCALVACEKRGVCRFCCISLTSVPTWSAHGLCRN